MKKKIVKCRTVVASPNIEVILNDLFQYCMAVNRTAKQSLNVTLLLKQ